MAQVMKKICHDKSLGVSVHVAMDSGIENKYVTIFRYHFKGVVISGSFTFVACSEKTLPHNPARVRFFATVTTVK